MGRKPNPDKVSRANLITRTIEFHTFRVKILPEDAEKVEYIDLNGIGSEDQARREVVKKAKEHGTVIDVVHVAVRSGLYGMTPERFIECGELLEEKLAKTAESNTETEDN